MCVNGASNKKRSVKENTNKKNAYSVDQEKTAEIIEDVMRKEG